MSDRVGMADARPVSGRRRGSPLSGRPRSRLRWRRRPSCRAVDASAVGDGQVSGAEALLRGAVTPSPVRRTVRTPMTASSLRIVRMSLLAGFVGEALGRAGIDRAERVVAPVKANAARSSTCSGPGCGRRTRSGCLSRRRNLPSPPSLDPLFLYEVPVAGRCRTRRPAVDPAQVPMPSKIQRSPVKGLTAHPVQVRDAELPAVPQRRTRLAVAVELRDRPGHLRSGFLRRRRRRPSRGCRSCRPRSRTGS